MSDLLIQASLNSGEWSPKLYARVDLAKYKSGAALLSNYFVDYRGGASTRAGTKYILQCFKSTTAVRLIPFQASFSVGYVLEFGDGYIRFFFNGAPVLEAAKSITGFAVGVFTSALHGYSNGNWIFAGNKYYIIQGATANTFTLTDLFGNAIVTNPFTLPTPAQRVYTITSPYAAADLNTVKFAQNVSTMILCHPSYPPYVLTLISATNWTMVPIVFGTSLTTPNITSVTTTLGPGAAYYSYVITCVDVNGQESLSSGRADLSAFLDYRVTPGTNTITWTAIPGAVSYNIYSAGVVYGATPPAGSIYGYIGSGAITSFADTNIAPDFSLTPPTAKNPFATPTNYPAVPGFFQQRLVLAGSTAAPQTFYMSQPGNYYNFNVSFVTQPDDAITGTLVSGQLNTIRAMVSQPAGLLMFTDRNNWLINGGTGQGSGVSPSAIVANAQSFNGISNVPPVTANFDILYVQAKGSTVRDSSYNIYSNVYTGTDISVLASHLFSDFVITEWAWAEEPFKLVYAIRNDGTLLNLTFLKEQEFVGWAHSTTVNGLFQSVATVVESVGASQVDAVYSVVQRTIQGQSLRYIERFAERSLANGVIDAWCVDCGIGYVGAPVTNFSGAEFLGGQTVTGLADGVVIPSFVMPANGNFALTTPASKVNVGLGFTCQLQTLPLDMGDPTIQGKVKKINAVDVRVSDALGLYIGSEFGNMVPMKDLVVGNVSSMLTGQSSQVVTDLVDGDARTFLDPTFTVPGQYCIEQRLPLPATVLGLISDYTIGDTGSRGR